MDSSETARDGWLWRSIESLISASRRRLQRRTIFTPNTLLLLRHPLRRCPSFHPRLPRRLPAPHETRRSPSCDQPELLNAFCACSMVRAILKTRYAVSLRTGLATDD